MTIQFLPAIRFNPHPPSQFSFFFVSLIVSSTLIGCGGGAPDVVPVAGQVTLAGGGWGRPGMIFFAPVEPAPGFPRLPGMADVDQEGRFRAITQPNRDGLVPGTYRVGLEMWEVPPTMGGPTAKSYLPQKYQSAATSGLEVVVPADGDGMVEVSWDIPRP
jgi:hypothetical protein